VASPHDNRWFPFGTPSGDALGRLFCLPFAGAGAAAYASWVRHAPPGLAVVPVQLPGREQRLNEPAERSLPRLVEQLTHEIAPLAGDAYSLFGHSMGALIVFELARSLRRAGCPPPGVVFVSGRGAPQFPIAERRIHTLPDRDFIREIRGLRGTPDSILDHEEFTSVFLPPLRADFALVETYRCAPDAPLASPISAFAGIDDAISPEAFDAWRMHTAARFQLRLLPGGHFLVASARDALLRAVAGDVAAAIR